MDKVAGPTDCAIARSGGSASLIAVSYGCAIALFWGLRFGYWQITVEEPFSDLADYVRIGWNVATGLDFAHDAFWRSYKLPGLPVLLGAVFWAVGSPDTAAFRVAQTTFVFGAFSWLQIEIYGRTRSHAIAVLGFVGLGLSQASIFWSFKPGTESVSEAFVFLSLASWLNYSRRRSTASAALAGAIVTAAALTRANFLPVLALFAVAVATSEGRLGFNRSRRRTIAFCLAVVLIWTPWIIRGYAIYGEPLLLSTQGPYSFLWELGPVTIREDDGSATTMTAEELTRDAPRSFPSDVASARYAGRFVRAWLQHHWREAPQLWASRINSQIVDRTESLSKVPRARLFDTRLDRVLIDKSWPLIVVGLLGYLWVGWRRDRSIIVLPLAIAGMMAFGAVFLSYPRMLDPLIGAIVGGAALLLGSIADTIWRIWSAKTPGTASP